MLKALKTYGGNLFAGWGEEEREVLLEMVDQQKGGKMADLGCGDRTITQLVASKMKPGEVIGMEAIDIKNPKKIKNFKLVKGDLNQLLPLQDEYFDVVISHFSLEHLYNSGLFIKECHRILKPGGYTVVATDNLATWPNIIALIMGWQPFSSTHGIALGALGNPLALRSGGHGGVDVEKELTYDSEEWRKSGEWSHNKVLAYRMLRESYEEFGFTVEEIRGAGYFPFSGFLSRFLAKLDPRHSHLLVLKARK
jgi:SAM-dependent methyltransferase